MGGLRDAQHPARAPDGSSLVFLVDYEAETGLVHLDLRSGALSQPDQVEPVRYQHRLRQGLAQRLGVGGRQIDGHVADRSLYATLRDLVGIEPTHATETLTATVLDDFEAAELQQKPGAPALVVERTTRDADGLCFEVVKSLLRADRFAISANSIFSTTPL